MSKCSKGIIFLALALGACLPLCAQTPLTQILQPSTPATGSSTTPTDQLGRDTPYGTVYGFLQAAQSGDYGIASQYLQMSPARRQSEGDAQAMRLYTVMNGAFAGSLRPSREPEGAVQEDVPPGRQRLGTMSSGNVEGELELVRVNDPSAGKIWLISSDTLAKVPELYEQVEARGVETRLPLWTVKHQFAGMPLWQWFACCFDSRGGRGGLAAAGAAANSVCDGGRGDAHRLNWRNGARFPLRRGFSPQRLFTGFWPAIWGLLCCHGIITTRSSRWWLLLGRFGFSGA